MRPVPFSFFVQFTLLESQAKRDREALCALASSAGKPGSRASYVYRQLLTERGPSNKAGTFDAARDWTPRPAVGSSSWQVSKYSCRMSRVPNCKRGEIKSPQAHSSFALLIADVLAFRAQEGKSKSVSDFEIPLRFCEEAQAMYHRARRCS